MYLSRVYGGYIQIYVLHCEYAHGIGCRRATKRKRITEFLARKLRLQQRKRCITVGEALGYWRCSATCVFACRIGVSEQANGEREREQGTHTHF